MTPEKIRLCLSKVRASIASSESEGKPATDKTKEASYFIFKFLQDEDIKKVEMWRESMYTLMGEEIYTLMICFNYKTGEELMISIPDHQEAEITLSAPEYTTAPGNLKLFIPLDDPENEAWSDLRTWGASLLPDPFLSD